MTKKTRPVSEKMPVAVWTGIELTLPSGRILPFLFCSAMTEGSGFFVEGAKPSAHDADTIRCPHCEERHYVVRLADAIEDGDLVDLNEACPNILLDQLLAIVIRDGARARRAS